ncbi:MAG: hypothetical protein ACK40X_11130 [Armatimonadota bacterium]
MKRSGFAIKMDFLPLSSFARLNLIDGPGTLQVIFASHTDCQIERYYIRQTYGTEPAVMVEWGSYGFVCC